MVSQPGINGAFTVPQSLLANLGLPLLLGLLSFLDLPLLLVLLLLLELLDFLDLPSQLRGLTVLQFLTPAGNRIPQSVLHLLPQFGTFRARSSTPSSFDLFYDFVDHFVEGITRSSRDSQSCASPDRTTAWLVDVLVGGGPHRGYTYKLSWLSFLLR